LPDHVAEAVLQFDARAGEGALERRKGGLAHVDQRGGGRRARLDRVVVQPAEQILDAKILLGRGDGSRGQGEDQDGPQRSHFSFTSRNSKGILRSWTAVTIDSSIRSITGGGGGRSSPCWISASWGGSGWNATVTSAASLFPQGER